MQQKTPVNGTYLIPSTGVFYDSLHHQRTNQMHDKCCDPRNHTLSQHHICRPFCAKFSLDRCNCRNTWCIQQAEDQKACGCHRCNCSREFCRTSKEYLKRRYHTFLCHKSCDQCSRNLPVSETKRKEYRCNDSCHNCQDTVLGICYHIHV